MIGLPVTALTESAAPPRASPSSLVSTTPSKSTRSAKLSATLTASWPVIASSTSRMSCGLVALADRDELVHQLLVDVQAPGGVDDQHVEAVPTAPGPSAHSAMSTGLALGALLVDGRAGALAHRHQLLDRGRALRVAGGERDLLALVAEVLGELRAGGRLARALQAGHQDHGRARGGEGEVAAGAAHQRGELLVDDLDHLLAGVEARRGPRRPGSAP